MNLVSFTYIYEIKKNKKIFCYTPLVYKQLPKIQYKETGME